MSLLSRDVDSLVDAFVAGEWTEPSMLHRCGVIVDGKSKWLPFLIQGVLKRFPGVRPTRRALTDFLYEDRRLAAASERITTLTNHIRMNSEFDCQLTSLKSSVRPTWTTVRQLADWFDLPVEHLLWFADSSQIGRQHPHGPLCHYHYRWVEKRRSGRRLIESPKPGLRQMQRRLLNECLRHLPVHDAAHGFCKGRSVDTFVQSHTGRQVVLRMDLQNYFPSLRPFRLMRLLMLAGYPEVVARTLSNLCTNTTPSSVLRDYSSISLTNSDRHLMVLLRQPHFPQGAPTSPLIANLLSYRLDARLQGLAQSAGIHYSRYADDLLFSGDERFRRCVKQFRIHVAAIVIAEGLNVNHRKSRIMLQSRQQRATGLVLNQHPAVSRRDFDLLKAILHNCIRFGPQTQNHSGIDNFRMHLLGRIQHMARYHPSRAQKLMHSFEQITF
ncbi:MAG: reverse transcriptase family protein [Planctomycetaceae bacterium]